jgi:hypothetical protein
MIHPSDSDVRSSAVRDGRLAPVTCIACGCRLDDAGDGFVHFRGFAGRDARGCRIDCAEAMHDADGRPVALPV